MRPRISEFSYGYAVTTELSAAVRWPLCAAPLFPSLRMEGRQGYDLAFPGVALFAQFKLTDYMLGRRGTREVDDGLFAGPFYRMHLRPLRISEQHRLLFDLEAKGNSVWYIAPQFFLLEDMNDAYLRQEVLKRSVFIAPSKIGRLPDDEDHHVAFQSSDLFYRLSRPEKRQYRIDFDAFQADLQRHVTRQKETQTSVRESLFGSLIDMLRMVYSKGYIMDIESFLDAFLLRDIQQSNLRQRPHNWEIILRVSDEQAKREDTVDMLLQSFPLIEDRIEDLIAFFARSYFECEAFIVYDRTDRLQ